MVVVITEQSIVEQLVNELDAKDCSHRRLNRILRTCVRHKLQPCKARLLRVAELLKVLETAGIDKADFFARVAQRGDLWLEALATSKKEHWTAKQAELLAELDGIKAHGVQGYAEVRSDLRLIELAHSENPTTAVASAWQLLKSISEPGAIAATLALIATASEQANAHRLLSLAFRFAGPELSNSLGARLLTAFGQCLFRAERYRESAEVLQRFALQAAGVFGDQDDHALALYYLALSAAKYGDQALNQAALEKVIAIGSERMRFAALQLIAFQELNLGDVNVAARMYDDLLRHPFFEVANAVARVNVQWSRLSAHCLAGRLTAVDEAHFRQVLADVHLLLSAKDQIAATLDFTLFLTRIGRSSEAARVLEATLWEVIDLEDSEMQRKFMSQWDSLGLPRESRVAVLANRWESKPPLPQKSLQRPGPSPRSRSTRPKK